MGTHRTQCVFYFPRNAIFFMLIIKQADKKKKDKLGL